MLDAVYIAVTVIFFTVMLVYVRACRRLGEDPSTVRSREETR